MGFVTTLLAAALASVPKSGTYADDGAQNLYDNMVVGHGLGADHVAEGRMGFLTPQDTNAAGREVFFLGLPPGQAVMRVPDSALVRSFDSLEDARRVLKLEKWKTGTFGVDPFPLNKSNELIEERPADEVMRIKQAITGKFLRAFRKYESKFPCSSPRAMGGAISEMIADAKQSKTSMAEESSLPWSHAYLEALPKPEQACKAAMLMEAAPMSAACTGGLEVRASDTGSGIFTGSGVFTTRKFAAKEVVTLWPAHFVGVHHSNSSGNSAKPVRWVQAWPDAKRTNGSLSAAQERLTRFALELPQAGLSIAADPRRRTDSGYLGHVVNDAASLASPLDIAAYHATSSKGANVMPVQVCRQACPVENPTRLTARRGVAACERPESSLRMCACASVASAQIAGGCAAGLVATKAIPAGTELFW